jgi:hypothetical protein
MVKKMRPALTLVVVDSAAQTPPEGRDPLELSMIGVTQLSRVGGGTHVIVSQLFL